MSAFRRPPVLEMSVAGYTWVDGMRAVIGPAVGADLYKVERAEVGGREVALPSRQRLRHRVPGARAWMVLTAGRALVARPRPML